MLEMRVNCERCGTNTPAEAPGAFICSLECTYCADCADSLDDLCSNCGGELMDRPTRSRQIQERYPPGSPQKGRA